MDPSHHESLALKALELIEKEDFDGLSELFADNFVLKAIMFPVGKTAAIALLKTYLGMVVPGTFEPKDIVTSEKHAQIDLHLKLKGESPVDMRLRCLFEFVESQIACLQIRPC